MDMLVVKYADEKEVDFEVVVMDDTYRVCFKEELEVRERRESGGGGGGCV